MNLKIRNILVTFLFAIYGLSMVADFDVSNHSDKFNTKSKSEHIFGIEQSKSLFYHTTQSENSLNNLISPLSSNFQNSLTSSFLSSKVADFFFRNSLKQYFCNTKKILVNFRKNDIIFPFHYFW